MSEQLPGTTPLQLTTRGEGWHHHRSSRRLTLGASGFLGGGLLVCAVGAAREEAWLAAVFLTVVGLAVLALTAGRDPRPRPVRLFTPPADPVEPPAPGTSTGVLVPTRPHRWTMLASWSVLGLLLAGAGVVAGVQGAVRGEVGGALGSVIPAGLGVLLLLAVHAGLRNRLTPHQGLLLRPDALVLRTEAIQVSVPWDTITRLRPHWTKVTSRGTTVVVNNWLSVETTLELDRESTTGVSVVAGTGTTPTLDIDALAAPPVAVLEVCRFYLEHPERRLELETERGVSAVQHGEAPR